MTAPTQVDCAPMYPELYDTLPPIATQRGGDPALLFDELLHEIRLAVTETPRSKQRRPGPSTLGSPCSRKIGYGFSGVEPVNDDPDSWKPTVGRAVHRWLEDTLRLANRSLGEPRWLLEFKLDVGVAGGLPVTGSCDVYDRVTATVIDWKITGDASLKRMRKAQDPGDGYRVQTQLYGYGWTRRGMPVDTVAIACLPQNASLKDSWYWHQPYEEAVALKAIERADAIAGLVNAAGTAALSVLPTAEDFCTFCKFYLPASTELATACPGHKTEADATPHPA